MSEHSSELSGRLSGFEAACRERGLSITIQRRLIFEALLAFDGHPTADDVYEAVRERIPGVSRTTVYRVLDTLMSIGVVRRLTHAGSVARYDPNPTRHHHLVCLECDTVHDVEEDQIPLDADGLPRPEPQEFTVLDFSIQYFGYCSACREKRPTRA